MSDFTDGLKGAVDTAKNTSVMKETSKHEIPMMKLLGYKPYLYMCFFLAPIALLILIMYFTYVTTTEQIKHDHFEEQLGKRSTLPAYFILFVIGKIIIGIILTIVIYLVWIKRWILKYSKDSSFRISRLEDLNNPNEDIKFKKASGVQALRDAAGKITDNIEFIISGTDWKVFLCIMGLIALSVVGVYWNGRFDFLQFTAKIDEISQAQLCMIGNDPNDESCDLKEDTTVASAELKQFRIDNHIVDELNNIIPAGSRNQDIKSYTSDLDPQKTIAPKCTDTKYNDADLCNKGYSAGYCEKLSEEECGENENSDEKLCQFTNGKCISNKNYFDLPCVYNIDETDICDKMEDVDNSFWFKYSGKEYDDNKKIYIDKCGSLSQENLCEKIIQSTDNEIKSMVNADFVGTTDGDENNTPQQLKPIGVNMGDITFSPEDICNMDGGYIHMCVEEKNKSDFQNYDQPNEEKILTKKYNINGDEFVHIEIDQEGDDAEGGQCSDLQPVVNSVDLNETGKYIDYSCNKRSDYDTDLNQFNNKNLGKYCSIKNPDKQSCKYKYSGIIKNEGDSLDYYTIRNPSVACNILNGENPGDPPSQEYIRAFVKGTTEGNVIKCAENIPYKINPSLIDSNSPVDANLSDEQYIFQSIIKNIKDNYYKNEAKNLFTVYSTSATDYLYPYELLNKPSEEDSNLQLYADTEHFNFYSDYPELKEDTLKEIDTNMVIIDQTNDASLSKAPVACSKQTTEAKCNDTSNNCQWDAANTPKCS
jgi:hypothetical protein